MTINHFDFPLPFTSELSVPYRANAELKRRVNSLFRNPINPFYQDFIDISTSGSRALVNDMAVRAISCVKYYMDNPQQFGNSMQNIELQVLVRMWKQIFKHYSMQNKLPKEYMGTSMKLLRIADGVMLELIRVVKDKDYIQSSDDMVKVRKTADGVQVGLRERKQPSSLRAYKNMEYLCSLD